MNDDDIWELARAPVSEFVESIKRLNISVDKLIKFYLKHTKHKRAMEHSKQVVEASASKQSTCFNEAPEDAKDWQSQGELSPLACAKLELAIVFSINACYWMYLVTNGEDPNKNEISKDMERLKLFMKRAKEVEDSLTGAKSSSKRPKIDKEASKRLCINNLSLKSNWT